MTKKYKKDNLTALCCIETPDRSMEPALPVTATLYFDTTRSCRSGDFAVIEFKHRDDLLIREYLLNDDDTVLLKAGSKDYDSYRCSLSELKENIFGIYPIVKMEKIFSSLPKTEDAETSVESGFYTFHEAMKILKIKRTKMYAILRSGELPALKLGKLWRIEKNGIEQYINSNRKKD